MGRQTAVAGTSGADDTITVLGLIKSEAQPVMAAGQRFASKPSFATILPIIGLVFVLIIFAFVKSFFTTAFNRIWAAIFVTVGKRLNTRRVRTLKNKIQRLNAKLEKAEGQQKQALEASKQQTVENQYLAKAKVEKPDAIEEYLALTSAKRKISETDIQKARQILNRYHARDPQLDRIIEIISKRYLND